MSENPNELGVSPLRQLATTIKIDDAARRYMSSSFGNAGRPSGAIIPPTGFKYQDGQKQELSNEVRRTYGGVDNAFKVALLAPGFDWKSFSFTAVESEVMAARQFGREEFAMAYDIPPAMIQDMTKGTYSNVEEAHRILYVTTLRPWLALLEEIVQAQLIDSEPAWADQGIFVRFDLTEVLRGNRREEIDAMSEAFNNGLMTLNECRKQLGLNPLAHPLADVPHIRSNNTKPIGTDTPVLPPGGETAAGNLNETQDPNQLKPPPPVFQPARPSRELTDTPSTGEDF
jgi:HK97 family phage portal protein